MNFEFNGVISSSKSLVNRYLILEKEHPHLNLKWSSEAKDVMHLKNALDSKEKEFWVGQGGTTLRFLAIYLSSKKGAWLLKGERELFKRPQEDLIETLNKLGAKTVLTSESLSIEVVSDGWMADEIEVSCEKTSQIASGLLITAVALNKKVTLKLKEFEKASKYLDMSIKFLKKFNAHIKRDENTLIVESVEEVKTDMKEIEGDWSSAAFLYSMGALFGSTEIGNLEHQDLSLQPDSKVISILNDIGLNFKNKKVEKIKELKAFKTNVKDNPDLFPVLAVLAAFAEGESFIYGAPQLAFKETNRIKEVSLLLTQCGYSVFMSYDGLKVKGEGMKILEHDSFDFDCSKDHRLVMAAFMLKMKGYKVTIKGIESINKSFPEFFEIFKRWL